MALLNLGILAHVDAGKTSLTERLLHTAGVIDELGRVDDGSTRTDSLDLERRRGITIKSAVVSFPVDDDTTVNLVDTPGHPDFIAEVERVLGVLDGAVLVVSAVEGVQAQTRVLLCTLRRLRIPTVVFVNKVDRVGAREAALLDDLRAKLTPAVVAMNTVPRGLGGRDARCIPYEDGDAAHRARLLDVLSLRDDAILEAYVEDERSLTHGRLRDALAEQTARAEAHPVYFGSAMTGAGVDDLVDGITRLLPPADGDVGRAQLPLSARVFKVERGPAGEKVAYARVFTGTLRVRDRLALPGGGEDRVTGVRVFADGADVPVAQAGPGQVARLWGLGGVRVGDDLGDHRVPVEEHHFAPPTLETVVDPVRPGQRGSLLAALTQLAEQDPLIGLRQDDTRQEIFLSLYGEVQKEVVQATLAEEFGLDVTFRETRPLCVERPTGPGEAAAAMKDEGNPFLATIGLRVDPAPVDSGVTFRIGIELGSLPMAFIRAIEETVHRTLREGLLGWQVTDCAVTLFRSGYAPRQSHAHAVFDKSMSSTAGDFRGLTPLVLMRALALAGTTVCEPMHRFHLDIPADVYATVMPALTRLGAYQAAYQAPPAIEERGPGQRPATSTNPTWTTIHGLIPAERIRRLQEQLPSLTRGEATLETTFDHYTPVHTNPPHRTSGPFGPPRGPLGPVTGTTTR
ncbi:MULTISPECIES: translation factor GTPase family protein [unclassified Streptomyces]|uniref:elongation factor G n=1 Tax=unclassified Streptomyces TaxID=2593676 RepID=UPI00278C06CA|nr:MULTISPECIES: TetM/TetW/TetO/TetS family tetracycline resistance ribosomal protection protein [unclassified Streptomyces]